MFEYSNTTPYRVLDGLQVRLGTDPTRTKTTNQTAVYGFNILSTFAPVASLGPYYFYISHSHEL
jgi:hypothetical protein